jgi:hypothetical protein
VPAAEPTSKGAPAEEPATSDPEPAEVGRRPSLGAVRRSKQAASDPAAAAPAPGEVSQPAAPPSEVAPEDGPDARDEPKAQPATPTPTVDRDSLTEAWGDGILRGLPARAKALFSAGRFVSVDAQGAHFALPNAAHRERCLEMVPTVEQKLSAHFGAPVTLVLEIDETASAPGKPARPTTGPGPDKTVHEPETESLDPAEYTEESNAEGNQASEAHARLLEAFPGASEVLG